MIEKLKSLGTVLVGLLFFWGLTLIIGLMIGGAAWVSDKVLPWFSIASLIGFIAFVFGLLPLSAIRKARPITAPSMLCLSYLFGATLWMEGLLTTLNYWGTWGVVIGVCLAGVGVVPLGALAALFHARWSILFELIILAVITFGSRNFSLWLGATLVENTGGSSRTAYREPEPSMNDDIPF